MTSVPDHTDHWLNYFEPEAIVQHFSHYVQGNLHLLTNKKTPQAV